MILAIIAIAICLIGTRIAIAIFSLVDDEDAPEAMTGEVEEAMIAAGPLEAPVRGDERDEMTDEDKEYLISVIESQIARWCDFTGFGADGVLAVRIANALESEFAFVAYKEKQP